MASQVITSGAKVIIRNEKSAYDGMMGKVLVSQGKGKWLVRMALDNYQFVVSGNNLEIANEAQPQDETAQLRAKNEALKAENARMNTALSQALGLRWEITDNAENALVSYSDEIRNILRVGLALQAPAPAQAASEVTLVDAEIAELDEREKNGVFFWYFGAEPGYPLSTKLVSVPDTDEDWQVSNGYKLAPEYNTPANRAAIEARRKALGLERLP